MACHELKRALSVRQEKLSRYFFERTQFEQSDLIKKKTGAPILSDIAFS